MTTLWKMAVHLAVASDVFGGVFLCCPVSHEMFWMRSGTKLSRFLRIFSTYSLIQICICICTNSVSFGIVNEKFR